MRVRACLACAWGVHFGSCGFGHKTASGFLALAERKRFDERAVAGEMDSQSVLFEVGSELGDALRRGMELAGEYAYAGRDAVVDKVLEILGVEAVHEVHNHHNFAWREEHFGRTYWVIRKGCTPARPGQEGFVGDSMGDESVILEASSRTRTSRRSSRPCAAPAGDEPLAGRPTDPAAQALGLPAIAIATASSTSTASAAPRPAEEGRLSRPS
ncbi:MAG: RtcB family protein [Actinomycetota bacterium]|nr:RtcB family protein [Actinomycetota bacterium]